MEEEKQKMYNYIEDIVNASGYEFLNMNDYYSELGLDFAADFSDYGGHVNGVGAQKCTAFLSSYIAKNYGLEDKRGEMGFESWDAAYEQWKQELEEAKKTIAKHIEEKDFADAPVEEPE